MKFGIYSSIADPPRGERLDQRIDEVIAEAKLAEEVGFDSCFFGEHHQDRDGFLPSPLIVATAVAAHTSTLNVGTSVILLPLHNPVHLAEDVITLDLVSKGRIILGVGLGYQEADFRAFEVPVRQRVGRFEEGVEVIRHCWSGEPFSFHGEYHQLENLHIRPSPYQEPTPPLWIGASTPPGARRAGRMADGFVAGPSTDLANTIELVETYREAAVRAGREPLVALMRDAWVAESRAEAEAVYGPEVMTAYKYYWRNGLNEFRRYTDEADINMANMAPDRLIIGEPQEVVDDFHRWQEATGADYFLLRLRHAHSGGPPHERIMEAIQLFGEEVIPHCQ
jgi:probable F420-dependent oxidoreductase